MITHPFFEEYKNLIKTEQILVNKERKLLIKILEENVLSRDDIYFDTDLIDKYIRFSEKWFFPLARYQKFITPFIFLYFKKNNEPFLKSF